MPGQLTSVFFRKRAQGHGQDDLSASFVENANRCWLQRELALQATPAAIAVSARTRGAIVLRSDRMQEA